MSAGVEYAKLVETAKYNEKEYNIQLAELGLSRESLLSEYNSQVLNYKNSILSAESQKDSYKEAMDLTQNVYLPQAQANLESYNALLNRWDDAFTAEMTATKQTGQQNYETLLGNFATVGVANAETGREGATANLLEQKQKQNVIDYVGADMTLDENGGLFGMTATQQALDLYADKASYESQIDILKQSVDMYQWNLNDEQKQKVDEAGNPVYDEQGNPVMEYVNPDSYAANMADIDTAIADYKAKVSEFESNVQKLAKDWGIEQILANNIIDGNVGLDKVYSSGVYESKSGNKYIFDKSTNTTYKAVWDEQKNKYVAGDEVDNNEADITGWTATKEGWSSPSKFNDGLYKDERGNYYIVEGDSLYIAKNEDGTWKTAGAEVSGGQDAVNGWRDELTAVNENYLTYAQTNVRVDDGFRDYPETDGLYSDRNGNLMIVENDEVYRAVKQSDGTITTGERLSGKQLYNMEYKLESGDYLGLEATNKWNTDKEAAAKAEQEAARQEQERLAKEEAARQEQERLAREEAARQEQERLAREEAARQEAERLAREEAERQQQQQQSSGSSTTITTGGSSSSTQTQPVEPTPEEPTPQTEKTYYENDWSTAPNGVYKSGDGYVIIENGVMYGTQYVSKWENGVLVPKLETFTKRKQTNDRVVPQYAQKGLTFVTNLYE